MGTWGLFAGFYLFIHSIDDHSVPLFQPEEQGFVEYQVPPSEELPPLTHSFLKIEPASLALGYHDIFEDDHWAKIPESSQIERQAPTTQEERERWIFPTGTEIVHRFRIRAKGKPPFEIRRMRMKSDGLWAFESFVPNDDGKSMRLRSSQENAPIEETSFKLLKRGMKVEVSLDRIHPSQCANCHAMHGDTPVAPNQPEEHAGPCQFSSKREAFIKDWAKNYQKKTGQNPFSN